MWRPSSLLTPCRELAQQSQIRWRLEGVRAKERPAGDKEEFASQQNGRASVASPQQKNYGPAAVDATLEDREEMIGITLRSVDLTPTNEA